MVRISQRHRLQFGLDAAHHRADPEATLTIGAAALLSPSLEPLCRRARIPLGGPVYLDRRAVSQGGH